MPKAAKDTDFRRVLYGMMRGWSRSHAEDCDAVNRGL